VKIYSKSDINLVLTDNIPLIVYAFAPNTAEGQAILPRIKDFWRTHNIFIDILRKVIFSSKVNNYINLRDSLLAKILLKNSIIADATKIYVWNNVTYFKQFLAGLSKWVIPYIQSPNQVFAFIDPIKTTLIHSNPQTQTRMRELLQTWKSVASYDQYDCDKYGFTFYFANYDPPPHAYNEINDIPSRDFSLFQSIYPDSPREKYTDKLFELNDSIPETERLTYYFSCAYPKYADRNNLPSPGYGEQIVKYQVGDVNCCVQFRMVEESDYLSIAHLSALHFNRKILTDAQTIKKLKCYDPRWIKVLDSPDDLTPEVLEWMKKREDVRYENLDEIGPKGFLDRIVEICRQQGLKFDE
jgi:hypothetical protein